MAIKQSHVPSHLVPVPITDRVWVNCILAPTIAGLPGDLQRQAQLKWPLAQVQASSNARQIQLQLFFTNAGQLQLSRN